MTSTPPDPTSISNKFGIVLDCNWCHLARLLLIDHIVPKGQSKYYLYAYTGMHVCVSVCVSEICTPVSRALRTSCSVCVHIERTPPCTSESLTYFCVCFCLFILKRYFNKHNMAKGKFLILKRRGLISNSCRCLKLR